MRFGMSVTAVGLVVVTDTQLLLGMVGRARGVGDDLAGVSFLIGADALSDFAAPALAEPHYGRRHNQQ